MSRWSDAYRAGWQRGLAVGFVRGGVVAIVTVVIASAILRWLWP